MNANARPQSDAEQIPGYDYGRSETARSPITLDELRALEACVGWSEADAQTLRKNAHIFREHAEEMVDCWRKVIGEQHELVKWFFGPDGKKDEEYAAKIKKRFVQWVVDVVERPHDQAWLDYQEEIGLRHTPQKKNQTDGANTPPVVPMRYLAGFVPVIAVKSREFFAAQGLEPEELQRLEGAWTRAVHLHVTLWTRPYVKDGLW